MTWSEKAREVIGNIHASLPADATFQQRRKAVFDAYPFGMRQYHPYKVWLTAQRHYLAQFEPPKDTKRFPLSPLEKMMAAHDS